MSVIIDAIVHGSVHVAAVLVYPVFISIHYIVIDGSDLALLKSLGKHISFENASSKPFPTSMLSVDPDDDPDELLRIVVTPPVYPMVNL
jgi:hypothetical protein